MKKRCANIGWLWLSAVMATLLTLMPSLSAAEPGSPLMWGFNNNGRLGNGTAVPSRFPFHASISSGLTAISAGSSHTLAVDIDGNVWAWGNNVFGELGDGTITEKKIPIRVKISSEAYLTGITAVSAGFLHSLALDINGNVWAWGHNDWGQTGVDPDYADYCVFASQVGIGNVVAISAGQGYSLALKADGTVWAWGIKLGTGTVPDSSFAPFQVESLSGIAAISAGWQHALALNSLGKVFAWGDNEFGQLGTAPSDPVTSPVQVNGLDGIIAISAGMGHSLALDDLNTVWAWGMNEDSQLGDGTTHHRSVPAPVRISEAAELGGIAAISAGRDHSLALDQDGGVWAWGGGENGELGVDLSELDCETWTEMTGIPPVEITVTSCKSLYALPVRNSAGEGHLESMTAISAGNFFSAAIGPPVVAATVSLASSQNPAHIGNPVTFTATVTPAGSGEVTPTGTVLFMDGNVLMGMATVDATGQATYVANSLSAGVHIVTALYSGDSEYGSAVSEAITQQIYEPIRIVTRLLPLGTEGVSYKQEIITAGGIGPTTWSLVGGSLPEGLQVADGSIVGTPESSGIYSFTVRADNDDDWDTKSLTIRISPPGVPYAFGWNDDGQLGNGSTEEGDYGPVIAPGGGPLSGIIAVSAGERHVIALDSQGGLWAWGSNGGGLLGTGTNEWYSAVPVRPAGVEGRVFTAIAAGEWHNLALDEDGTVWTWGGSDSWLPASDTPTRVLLSDEENAPYLTNIVAIAIGTAHALALDEDGTVWAWGNTGRGQLGQGDPYMGGSNFPIKVKDADGSGNLRDIVAIAAGGDVSVALTRQGHVYEWGRRRMNETYVTRHLPVKVVHSDGTPLSDIAAISAGWDHILALTHEGLVWSWGDNAAGQLGTGMGTWTEGASNPVLVLDDFGEDPLTNIIAISAGEQQSMAIDARGIAWYWGMDTWSASDIYPETGAAVGISNGYGFSVVLEGSLAGTQGWYYWNTPPFLASSNLTDFSSDGNHTLALDSQGNVWAFGSNSCGELGLGDYDRRSSPTQVTGLDGNVRRFTKVSAGSCFSLALDSEGYVWAWGDNSKGLLGIGGGDLERLEPVRVAGGEQGVSYLKNIVSISAGQEHALAVDSLGRVWAWGVNESGRLGTGDYISSSTPVEVFGLWGHQIVEAVAGDLNNYTSAHSLALDSDGYVWAWGNNYFGALAQEAGNIDNPVPARIDGLDNIVAIDAGAGWNIALRQDGTVWTWGYNDSGQLGNGNLTGGPALQRVVNDDDPSGFLTNISSIVAGREYAMVRAGNGALWAWGRNDTGTARIWRGEDYSSVPVLLHNYYGFTAIGTSSYRGFVIKGPSSGYTVTPSASAGGTISPATPQTVNENATVSFTISPAAGYHVQSVTGCGGSLSGNTYTTGPVTADCTVTASFAINTHTVTPMVLGLGTISPATQQTVNHGETTSFTITPAEGYLVGSASGCGGTLSGDTYTTGPVTTNCTVLVLFSPPAYYSVGTSAGEGGTISPPGYLVDPALPTVSFTITPDEGYHIQSVAGCNGSLSGNTYTTGPVTADCTVTVTFAINTHAVTPSAGEGGTISPSTPQMVNYGATVSFTITPDEGYHVHSVIGCGGSLSGTTYTTGPVTANCTVTASFVSGSLLPATNLAAADPDDVFAGVDGRDFLVSWTPSISEGVARQEIYILPQGVLIDTSVHLPVAAFDDNTTAVWTGDSSLSYDSAGELLTDGTYGVYLVSRKPGTLPDAIQISTDMVAVREPGNADADFNGDGKADLLLQDQAGGNLLAWYMNGENILESEIVATRVGPNWSTVGSADFDGDGDPDILWRNDVTGDISLWYMDGAEVVSDAYVATVADQAWQIAGLSDMDGNGTPDILWHHEGTGFIIAWFIDGGRLEREAYVNWVPNVNWEIRGLADFNRDGAPDILWQNHRTGGIKIWFMNGINLAIELPIEVVDPVWEIVGASDFDGDGSPDILWQHRSSRRLSLWLMDGPTIIGVGSIGELPVPWEIVNP